LSEGSHNSSILGCDSADGTFKSVRGHVVKNIDNILTMSYSTIRSEIHG